MKHPNRHIIQKLAVELTCPDESAGKQMYQAVGDYIRTDILPELEVFFDQVAPAGKHLRLDRLDLDLGVLPVRGWEQALKQQILEQVKQQMASFRDTSEHFGDEQKGTPEQRAVAAYFFFLEHGHLPWWNTTDQITDLEKMLQAGQQADSLAKQMQVLFQQNIQAIRRFARQVSPGFFRFIWAEIQPASWKKGVENTLEKVLRKAMPAATARQWIQEAALLWAISSEAASGLIAPGKVLQQLAERSDLLQRFPTLGSEIGETPEKDISEKEQMERQVSKAPEEADWYVSDAGIVLISPFLPTFFENIGLMHKQAFTGIEQQEMAVLWLHYLCTGSRVCPEDGTLLLKLLCGLPPEHPIPQRLRSDAKKRKEAEFLLQTVIEHWSALGKVSPDALREGFLQRTGKITNKGGQWQLVVERKTLDILFDKLPWGFSIIKYPWMQEMLIVEW